MGTSTSIPLPPTTSVELEGTADHEAGLGAIRRSTIYKDELRAWKFEDAQTLYQNFQRGLKVNPDGACLGHRPIDAEGEAGDFVFITYREAQADIDAIGSALVHLNLAPEVSDDATTIRPIGLFSKNRVEWVLTEQGCNTQSLCTVPLYDTLGNEAINHILHQAGLKTVFCESDKELTSLTEVKAAADGDFAFDTVVQFTDIGAETRAAAEEAGLTVYSLADILTIGNENKKEHNPPAPDTIATLCYTSGTTGLPKGAMLTHGSMIADASGAFFAGVSTTSDEVHLSYLPLAHVFERLVQVVIFMTGGRVGFFQGSPLKIMDDLKALRPTLFPSVPRLYNRIYDKITNGANAAGGLKAMLFNKGLTAKKYWLQRNCSKYGFWDSLVFNKIKARVGLDRCRIMVTGSAPIAAHVMEFLRCVFGVTVLEGYGQTECSAAATVTSPADQATLGHVGGPLACNEVRLVSVPEMDYNVTDEWHGRVEEDGNVVVEGIKCSGRGEVCYRGANIFAGYFRQPEKTAEALDEDGWLHSGDIGLWDKNGNLKIVDRKKNIFKLSQGEYIAAEKIENAYARSPFVAQVFVYGDSLQSCVVGICVPDQEYLVDWAKSNGKSGKSFAELVADEEVKAVIWNDMKAQEKEAKLKGFEKIKALTLDHEMWSVDNNLLTPTFKAKRPQLKGHYQDTIDAMYASGIGVVAGQAALRQGQVA